jgi:hypothetical protein
MYLDIEKRTTEFTAIFFSKFGYPVVFLINNYANKSNTVDELILLSKCFINCKERLILDITLSWDMIIV